MRRYTSLSGRREFALVLRRGRTCATKAVSISALRAKDPGQSKVGIVITAKVGNAVVRNRLRRRCKAIMDETGIPGATWFVVVFRAAVTTLTYAQLRQQLAALLGECAAGAGNSRTRRESKQR